MLHGYPSFPISETTLATGRRSSHALEAGCRDRSRGAKGTIDGLMVGKGLRNIGLQDNDIHLLGKFACILTPDPLAEVRSIVLGPRFVRTLKVTLFQGSLFSCFVSG